jgi:uncharacterized cupredoxin-like copper-binding protein
MQRTALRLLALAVLTLLVDGCGGAADDRSPRTAEGGTPEAPAGSATTVKIALEGNSLPPMEDFSITAEPAQAPAGTVTFELTATGDHHNFIVIKTELAPDDLPLRSPAGPVVTDMAEVTEVIGLVPIPFTGEKELTVDAGPGDYVLICNAGAHYVSGMRTSFTVA